MHTRLGSRLFAKQSHCEGSEMTGKCSRMLQFPENVCFTCKCCNFHSWVGLEPLHGNHSLCLTRRMVFGNFNCSTSLYVSWPKRFQSWTWWWWQESQPVCKLFCQMVKLGKLHFAALIGTDLQDYCIDSLNVVTYTTCNKLLKPFKWHNHNYAILVIMDLREQRRQSTPELE